MKIDADLRQAIRSACNAQPDEGWQKQAEKRKLAIGKLLTLKKHRAKAAKMVAIRDKARNDLEAADEYFHSIGISGNLSDFYDEAAFKRSGGVIPHRAKPWRFDDVMRELAAAKPSDRHAILSKYGINWS